MLTPESFLESLKPFPEPAAYRVAYSGGRDSHVLLHLAASVADRLPCPVSAIHVDHGLQPDAAYWARHCEAVCAELGVGFRRLSLDLEVTAGESLEAQAREARYRALADGLGEGELLLTAHHREDQAETLLLQLLRGAGAAGLAAMPALSHLGAGRLGRPLLAVDTAQLAAYARRHGLHWIEDPSNRDLRFDRNYLRHRVMPLLAARWPALGRTLSRSARHCAEAQHLIDELAAGDLQQVAGHGTLSLPALARLSPPRARALLRAWIGGSGFRVPDTARLDRLLREMTTAAADRNPLVHWPGAEARRYRDRLYLMPPLQLPAPGLCLPWDGVTPLPLPARLGRLQIRHGSGGIDPERWRKGPVTVRFGRLSGRLRLAGQGRSRGVKQLYQEWAVPPWERPRLPLIHVGGALAAVADLGVCEPFGSATGGPGIHIDWQRHGEPLNKS